MIQIGRSLLNFFLKPPCPLCDRPAEQTLCIYCHRQVLAEQLSKPQSQPGAIPVFAWGSYGGALKRAIGHCKYQNHPEIATYLGDLLGQAWLEQKISGDRPPLLLPIPLHAAKQKQRGFNQAALIAKGLSQRSGGSVNLALQRIKATEAQFQLSPQARQQNLQDAFQLRPNHRLQGRSVWLIDDIYTTGATVQAALATLTAAKVSVIGVAVAAIAGVAPTDSV